MTPTNKIIIGLTFALATCAQGQNIPSGLVVPKTTLSPDRHYGVRIPIFDLIRPNTKKQYLRDSLIDMKTGRVPTELQGDEGYDHALNWLEVMPSRWSHDGSLLPWEVSRKWCPGALDLVKISKGKVGWQVDLLKVVQRAILPRTKQATPRKYAAAKKENTGSFDPALDGFIIDVRASDPVKFPVQVEAVLTSDPKSYGEGSQAPNSHLEGVIDAEGKFVVKSFYLGVRTWDRF